MAKKKIRLSKLNYFVLMNSGWQYFLDVQVTTCCILQVNSTEQSTIRPCKLVMSSLVKQVGYGEGLQWMAKQIQETERWYSLI